jgi:hypothetical protein
MRGTGTKAPARASQRRHPRAPARTRSPTTPPPHHPAPTSHRIDRPAPYVVVDLAHSPRTSFIRGKPVDLREPAFSLHSSTGACAASRRRLVLLNITTAHRGPGAPAAAKRAGIAGAPAEPRRRLHANHLLGWAASLPRRHRRRALSGSEEEEETGARWMLAGSSAQPGAGTVGGRQREPEQQPIQPPAHRAASHRA